MENNINHKSVTTHISTTPALERLAEAVSKKVGTCKRNSVTEKDGVGYSISHGYNSALLIAAESLGLADLTKQEKKYLIYKSTS